MRAGLGLDELQDIEDMYSIVNMCDIPIHGNLILPAGQVQMSGPGGLLIGAELDMDDGQLRAASVEAVAEQGLGSGTAGPGNTVQPQQAMGGQAGGDGGGSQAQISGVGSGGGSGGEGNMDYNDWLTLPPGYHCHPSQVK